MQWGIYRLAATDALMARALSVKEGQPLLSKRTCQPCMDEMEAFIAAEKARNKERMEAASKKIEDENNRAAAEAILAHYRERPGTAG